MSALAVLAVAAVAGAVVMRSRARPASGAPSSVDSAIAALSGPDARLACPIFEVRG